MPPAPSVFKVTFSIWGEILLYILHVLTKWLGKTVLTDVTWEQLETRWYIIFESRLTQDMLAHYHTRGWKWDSGWWGAPTIHIPT